MTVSNWYVDVDFKISGKLPHGADFDVLDVLSDYKAVIAVSRSGTEGSVTFVVESTGISEAFAAAGEVWEKICGLLNEVEIVKTQITSEGKRLAEANEFSFPELVGYAEIAEMAHVSRQRARELASREDFPVPVVETAAGPLRMKTAVEEWLSKWDRTPGRPRRNNKTYESV